MKKIRIGIIGCGWFGNRHLDYLLTEKDVQVVALATGNEEKLLNTAQKVPGVKTFSTHEAMFQSTPMDAALICVPPSMHGEMEQTAAKKGIHLYVEKPLGVSNSTIQENIRIMEASGILCSVGYQERYGAGIDEAREELKAHSPRMLHGRWLGSLPQVHWWRQKKLSGGQVVEQCTHIVDLMRYFAGEARCAHAVALPQINEAGDVEAASILTLSFENGAIGTLQTGCFLQQGIRDVGLNLYAENLAVKFRWEKGVQFQYTDRHVQYLPKQSNHDRALAAFLQAIRTKDAALIRSNYADAAKTFQLTTAMQAAIEARELNA